MMKIKGSLLFNGFIITAFVCLAAGGVLLNLRGDSLPILGKALHPKMAGMGLITIGVVLYFTGRVMGTFKKIRSHRQEGRRSATGLKS